MTTIVAKATGNYSATGTWTGDAVPGSTDTAQTGAYTVTIDGDITATAIEATSSGHFVVSAAIARSPPILYTIQLFTLTAGLRLHAYDRHGDHSMAVLPALPARWR